MKHVLLSLLLLITAADVAAQVTLDSCKAWARANYPVIRQFGLVEQTRRFTVGNAAKAWLPQVSFTATASYQSDVTAIPVDIPGVDMPTLDKDQYDVNFTVSQQVYDGGAVASARRMANAQGDVAREQVNVAMYDVYERVEQLFFGILVLDGQLEQVRLLQDDLALGLGSVSAMMKGGIANQTDVDAVMVEQAKARQTETGLLCSRRAYLRMLETFTGRAIADADTLVRPSSFAVNTIENRRPELALYAAKDRLLDARSSALDVDLRPRFGVFLRGGYGKPGLDMLSNRFDAYYKVGATLTWNIGSLYTRGNDKRKIEAERQMNTSDRDAFLFNSGLQTELQNGAIDNLRRQLEQDDEIIKLRERIRSKSETKVENGTETVNEMLRDINAVSEARLAKRLHEIQLLQEIYKLRNINGL